MAFGTITSTSNTFGSVDGTATGAVPGTLSGSVGVPGPQGPAGPTGPAGAAGQGVPAGGTAGQFLTKIDGTNYNTDWTTLNLSAYAVKANNLSDLTNASTARNNLSLGPTNTVAFRTVNLSEGAVDAGDTLSTLSIATGAGGYGLTASTESFVEGDTSPIVSESGALNLNKNGFYLYRFPTYNTTNPSSPTSGGEMNYVATTGVLTIRAFDTGAATDDTITVEPTGVTFADTTKQTTAFLPADYYTASYIDTTFAPLASPVFTGDARAVTAALGDNDTSIATTAFVQQELLSGTANAKNLEVYVRNQTGSTIPAGSIVYINGATGNRPTVTLAQANNDANSAQTIGFTKTSIANNGFGFVIVRGELENIDTSALTEGVQLYLSPTTAGTWTTTKPSAPQHLVYVGVVIRSHPTLGTILVSVQNGFEVAELHDSAISSPANNDLFVYELSTDLWKNKSFATLGLATQSFVTSQGYITSAALTPYATLASPSLTGTPLAPTPSVNVNSTQIATTAFVRDMLMDPTYSVPPIVSTTTVTSGTGATYVNASPDFGYLVGPNANLAGFCQKQFQMFARSNSTYGFNFTRNIKVACKIALNWSGTFTAITQTLFFRLNTGTVNGTLSQIGFGISINLATKALSILAHNGTTLTTKATSWTVPFSGIASVDFMVESNGAGTVFAYADGVLIDSTTGMSTASNSGATTSALAQVEVNSAGGTSTAGATSYVSNLRAFVAHG